MLKNRSMPSSVIIPELAYPDVAEAVAWLCDAFGFEERLRIGNHRAQLSFGPGAVIVREATRLPPPNGNSIHSIMVRIEHLDRHYEHAVQCGVRILNPPADYPYGERQYTASDLVGHIWTFSQTIADVDPATWGGDLR
jgi:uncharacterized glyoxalase superfamily protein PhnB